MMGLTNVHNCCGEDKDIVHLLYGLHYHSSCNLKRTVTDIYKH